MIRIVTYYRAASALPLLVPIAAYFLGVKANLLSPYVSMTLWFSLIIGGIPYSILAVFMIIWMRGKSEKAIHHFIYLSPFIMVALLAIGLPLFSIFRGESPFDRNFLDAISLFGIFALILGYSYVAIIQLVYWGLKAMKKVSPHNQAL